MIDIMKQMPAQGMRLVETLPMLFQGEINAHRFINGRVITVSKPW